jgi:hypothetical protein
MDHKLSLLALHTDDHMSSIRSFSFYLLQDQLRLGADDRSVLDGAVPGHLPPAVPVRHVGLQPGRQNHHRHLDHLLLSRLPLRLLHQGQLYRQVGVLV